MRRPSQKRTTQPPQSVPRLLPRPNLTPNHPTSPFARALTGATSLYRGICSEIQNIYVQTPQMSLLVQTRPSQLPQSQPPKHPLANHTPHNPNITQRKIPHGSYGPKQGNPCLILHPKPPFTPEAYTQVGNNPLTPPKPPTGQTRATPPP